MLVLVAGITGNLGQKLTSSLLARGHQVRGLGRSPSKMPSTLSDKLESFVQNEAYHDVPALDKACAGVDAIICAYGLSPELMLEGQLLLLRAAERAGVTKFIATGWTNDWRGMPLGKQDTYDTCISFANHVELTSSIKPIYVFVGMLVEVFFSASGRIDFTPASNGIWDSKNREVHVWGDPKTKWRWTSEADAAEFTVAILENQSKNADVQKQFWNVCSGMDSLEDIAKIYGKVRGGEVAVKHLGTVEELRKKAYEMKEKGNRNRWWEYIMFFYVLHTVDGTWDLEKTDNDETGVVGISMQELLEKNPEF